MNSRCLFVLVWLSSVLASGAAETKVASRLGDLFFAPLTNAPFPHASRKLGYQYDNTTYEETNHYSDSRTGFFIPKGFRAGTNVDVVVHFHGWRAKVEEVPGKFQLLEQFAASRRNAILILPQGPRNAPDSSGGKLEDAGGFARFLDEALATLRAHTGWSNVTPGRVVLAGHSGGYRVIASILDDTSAPRVDEVYLFDALYGQGESFLRFLEGRTESRMVVVYTKDGGTLKETQKFIRALREKKIAALVREENGLKPRDLHGQRAYVLFSDLSHNEVLYGQQEFRDYLSTGGLEDILPK